MKLGNVISDAVYEQRLAELVSKLEARIRRTQNRAVRSGRTAAMIRVFETAGNRFGITRERVRQIIEAPMTQPPTRARRLSYLPAAVWAGFEDELQEVRCGTDTNHQA